MNLGEQTIITLDAPLVQGRTGAFYRDWDAAVQTVIPGCSVQPFILAEKLNYTNDSEREFTKNSWRVYAPPDAVVSPEARVIYQGVEHDVQGIPGDWVDLDGVKNHKAFLIRERRG